MRDAGNTAAASLSFTRVAAIVRLLVTLDRPIGPRDLGRLLATPQSTAYRALRDMCAAGLLVRSADGKYSLAGDFAAGLGVPVYTELRRACMPYLIELCRIAACPAQLAVAEGGNIRYLDCVRDGAMPVPMGTLCPSLPLSATAAGRVLSLGDIDVAPVPRRLSGMRVELVCEDTRKDLWECAVRVPHEGAPTAMSVVAIGRSRAAALIPLIARMADQFGRSV